MTNMYSNTALTTASTAEAMFKADGKQNVVLSDVRID
jgi:hypothetical protein